MKFTIEQIAEVAHEANAAYCRTIGDHSQPTWEEAPDWQKRSAIDGVEYHLSQYALGVDPPVSHSHEIWMREKLKHGWKLGEVKDGELKTHPQLVPYDDLPMEQKIKDYLFAAVVKAFSDCEKTAETTPHQTRSAEQTLRQ